MFIGSISILRNLLGIQH